MNCTCYKNCIYQALYILVLPRSQVDTGLGEGHTYGAGSGAESQLVPCYHPQ
jgi:hypothetical protein